MMKKSVLWGAVAAIGLLGATSGQALAKSVCYQFGSANDFVRLDVKFHSFLTTLRERRKFDTSLQSTYSVHGSFNIGPETLPLEGTITVGPGVGAQLALTNWAVLARVEGQTTRSVSQWECVSEDATWRPERWGCQVVDILTDQGITLSSPFALEQVDPLQNAGCGTFGLPPDPTLP